MDSLYTKYRKPHPQETLNSCNRDGRLPRSQPCNNRKCKIGLYTKQVEATHPRNNQAQNVSRTHKLGLIEKAEADARQTAIIAAPFARVLICLSRFKGPARGGGLFFRQDRQTAPFFEVRFWSVRSPPLVPPTAQRSLGRPLISPSRTSYSYERYAFVSPKYRILNRILSRIDLLWYRALPWMFGAGIQAEAGGMHHDHGIGILHSLHKCWGSQYFSPERIVTAYKHLLSPAKFMGLLSHRFPNALAVSELHGLRLFQECSGAQSDQPEDACT